MKFFVVIASLVAAAAAQGIVIFNPTSGSTLTPGQNVTVSVVEANSLTNIEEIGIGIALRLCDPSPCDANGALGTSLYTGTYHPQFDPATENMPNQNFTVTVPSDISSGSALLTVVHAAFLGASTEFLTQIVNTTVNIA